MSRSYLVLFCSSSILHNPATLDASIFEKRRKPNAVALEDRRCEDDNAIVGLDRAGNEGWQRYGRSDRKGGWESFGISMFVDAMPPSQVVDYAEEKVSMSEYFENLMNVWHVISHSPMLRRRALPERDLWGRVGSTGNVRFAFLFLVHQR